MTDAARPAPGPQPTTGNPEAMKRRDSEHRQVYQEAVDQTGPAAPMDDWTRLVGKVHGASPVSCRSVS